VPAPPQLGQEKGVWDGPEPAPLELSVAQKEWFERGAEFFVDNLAPNVPRPRFSTEVPEEEEEEEEEEAVVVIAADNDGGVVWDRTWVKERLTERRIFWSRRMDWRISGGALIGEDTM
jgi:hypothetical protein